MTEEVQTTTEEPDPEAPATEEVDAGVDWRKLALLGLGMLVAGGAAFALNEYLMRRSYAARERAARTQQAPIHYDPVPEPEPATGDTVRVVHPVPETVVDGQAYPKHLAASELEEVIDDVVGD